MDEVLTLERVFIVEKGATEKDIEAKRELIALEVESMSLVEVR